MTIQSLDCILYTIDPFYARKHIYINRNIRIRISAPSMCTLFKIISVYLQIHMYNYKRYMRSCLFALKISSTACMHIHVFMFISFFFVCFLS